MKWIKQHKYELLFSVLIALIFMSPYLVKPTLNLEHDTFFHLSRIEGYARAIARFDFFPKIYPYKNAGFGYGSPLFYSDIFLLLPAILYNFGVKVSVCYKIIIFFASFFSSLAMIKLIKQLSKNTYAPYLAAALYLFSTYRLTDVYVRGALGEVIAFTFLPIVVLGIYYFLQSESKKSVFYLVLGFTGLVLSHNITFFLACILLAAYLFLNIDFVLENPKQLLVIVKAALITIGLTSFFLFGMLEQMVDHKMIVHYYASSSDLASSALSAWQFTYNKLIFGLAGNSSNYSSHMVVNLGWFLLIAPLFDWINNKLSTTTDRFIQSSRLAGYFFMFICSAYLPWKALKIFSVLQFPFRFMTIALVLLAIPASIGLLEFLDKFSVFKKFSCSAFLLCCTLILFNFYYLITPVFSRTFVISDKADYSAITSGQLTDPYYSASYMRVELAGGDYLPFPSVDYRGYAPCVRDHNQETLTCDVIQDYTTISFTLDQANSNPILLPLTYYKGYQAYDNSGTVKTFMDINTGLVCIQKENLNGNITVKYVGTLMQTVGLGISAITLIYLLIKNKVRKLFSK